MKWSPFKLRSHAEDSISDLPALRAAAETLAANVMQGAHAQKKAGGHEKFWQFREYQDSDRPQDIDWRQSARGDHIYVREKELQTPQSTYIWCNRSASMDFQSHIAQRSKADAAKILSLASAILLQREEEQVGFLGGGRSGRSEAALDRIGQQLFENAEDMLPSADAAKNSRLLLCSDFLQPLEEIEAGFTAYGARHGTALLVQVLDPAELELPYSGHMVFEGMNGAHEKIDNVSGIRSAYKTRIQAHLNGLRALCDDLGWHIIVHRTDMPLDITMFDIWEQLQAQGEV